MFRDEFRHVVRAIVDDDPTIVRAIVFRDVISGERFFVRIVVFIVSFDFFFAKEGNDLLEFCFLSVVVVVVVVVIALAKAELDLVSFLFVVRGLGRRLMMMTTMEIYLYRVRERISAVSRERKKEISLLFRSTKEALRASNVSTTYALKP
jgi:hypothetical protein